MRIEQAALVGSIASVESLLFFYSIFPENVSVPFSSRAAEGGDKIWRCDG
jgi:hypothetical protein